MKHNYCCKDRRVYLRPLSPDDAEKMRILRNKNAASFFTSAQITSKAQQAWYQRYLTKPDDYMFSVYLSETNQWIGAVGLYDVDQERQTAEFGRLIIDQTAAGQKGLGVDATLAACQIAFEQLNLKSVYLEVYADNIPAVRTYEKAGFSFVGEHMDSNRRIVKSMILNK